MALAWANRNHLCLFVNKEPESMKILTFQKLVKKYLTLKISKIPERRVSLLVARNLHTKFHENRKRIHENLNFFNFSKNR